MRVCGVIENREGRGRSGNSDKWLDEGLHQVGGERSCPRERAA